MQAMSGGPSTPIEQVTELGEGIIQKLVAAGITTVEGLADMTPEQLEEIPGIGEKTLERISVAVRHYFGHFEEGEAGAPSAVTPAAEAEAVAAELTEEKAAPEAAQATASEGAATPAPVEEETGTNEEGKAAEDEDA
jgi:N utilization substance protein A